MDDKINMKSIHKLKFIPENVYKKQHFFEKNEGR